MFQCKTFYIVKYFSNANDFRKFFFFSVFVCTLEKCSGKYSTLCVWSNIKQINRKYPHPKPPESTKNDHPCQPASHPNPPHNLAAHPNPPCNPATHPAAHPNPPRNPLEQKPPHRTTRYPPERKPRSAKG